MLTLCIDTAYKYLTCVLIQDNKIISSYSEECFKKQSEEVFIALKKVFEEGNINPKDIDSICISKGPGSYTGVRIAMSIAKTIGEVLPCDIYTISTLRLYAANKGNCLVLMDARNDRAYAAIYDKDKTVMEDCIVDVKQLDYHDRIVIGDTTLIGRKTDNFDNIAYAFLATKYLWKKVDNIAYLVPEYLKESEKYYL